MRRIKHPILKRLNKIVPIKYSISFKNGNDLLAWNQATGKKNSQKIIYRNKKLKIQRFLNDSGIKRLHRNCSFKNYYIQNTKQRKALYEAQKYAYNFDFRSSNFVFSGFPGTGKNHLASAIIHHLIVRKKKILITTVADLMLTIRDVFNGNSIITEKNIVKNLSEIDLLVIDEIGIQVGSKYEKVIINQIVNRRSSAMKPTGMLTNLDYDGMSNLLGERLMYRIRSNQSIWVPFTWDSYKNQKSKKTKLILNTK